MSPADALLLDAIKRVREAYPSMGAIKVAHAVHEKQPGCERYDLYDTFFGRCQPSTMIAAVYGPANAGCLAYTDWCKSECVPSVDGSYVLLHQLLLLLCVAPA
jgi:hypothetical protein